MLPAASFTRSRSRMSKYVLALDQGTTSSRAIVFDRRGMPVATAQQEFRQIFPQPGWVEHDASEIWSTQLACAQTALRQAGAQAGDIAAIGVTNQRETVVLWDRATGDEIACGGHSGGVLAVAFSPDGTHIATASGYAHDDGDDTLTALIPKRFRSARVDGYVTIWKFE